MTLAFVVLHPAADAKTHLSAPRTDAANEDETRRGIPLRLTRAGQGCAGGIGGGCILFFACLLSCRVSLYLIDYILMILQAGGESDVIPRARGFEPGRNLETISMMPFYLMGSMTG